MGLADFRGADLIVKAEVSGHRTARLDQDFLVNQMVVQRVMRGDVAEGDKIDVSSGGGICLPLEDELYLFLSKGEAPFPGSVYWMIHPQGLFPIVDSHVQIHESLRTEDDWLTALNGVTEDELRRQIEQAIDG